MLVVVGGYLRARRSPPQMGLPHCGGSYCQSRASTSWLWSYLKATWAQSSARVNAPKLSEAAHRLWDMAFPANVLRVMIASPSDTVSARDAVERALYDWNQSNSANRHVVLMPWRWETSAVPETGAHPQSLINAQGVAQSDIVIALFGSKLGTPTPAHVSGTVEEITEAEGKGVPVHIYFSTAPLPHDVDTEQLEGLRTFKRELQEDNGSR